MQKHIKKITLVNGMMLKKLGILAANSKKSIEDIKGESSSMLALAHRYIGISDFIIGLDIGSYKKNLIRSVELMKTNIDRYENGEPISKSNVSILCYKELFDALATGDMTLAKEYAQLVGGRPEIEKEFDHPFDIALGYALKGIVLETDDVVDRLAAFRDQLSKKGNKSFKGFVEAFEAIHRRESQAFETGLNEIIRCYPGLRKGVFDHSLDAHLCVWGIGLINLAKHKGLVVDFDHELMPKELQST